MPAADINEVVKQQEHQEGRLSTLEAEVRHVTAAVGNLTATIESSFRDTRELLLDTQTRSDRKTSEIHERLDRQMEKGRWNPALTFAILTFGILVGSIFVGFVVMAVQPIDDYGDETRAALVKHTDMPSHLQAAKDDARFTVLHADHALEIEKLHTITDKLLLRWEQSAYARGACDARITELKEHMDNSTLDRFYGREGRALAERIRVLEVARIP
jgi:hypothetical protein